MSNLTVLRKHAPAELRRLGIADPHDFKPHELSWDDLCKVDRDLGRLTRTVADRIKPDEMDQMEAAIDGALDLRDMCEREKDFRTQIGSRDARANGFHPDTPIPEDGAVDGFDEGGGYVMRHRARQEDEGEEATCSLRHDQRMTGWARERRAPDIKGLTSGGLLRAMVLGPQNDAEKRALAEGTDSAGGYTVPDILAASMIDRMRAASVISRAGARTIPLTSDTNYIAKLLTDPVPAWRAENDEIDNSDATFGRVTLAPKSLAVLCRVSRELLEDSLNIGTSLPAAIAKAMALEVDRMALFGSGTPPEPQGLTLMSGIGEVALDGLLSSHASGVYGSLIEARGQLLAANAPEPTAFILNPREDETLVSTVNGNGDPLQAPAKIAAIPQLITTAVPKTGGGGTESSIITGYFPMMLLGIRNTLRIEILKERYAEFHQYAFIAHLRATVAVEQAAAFSQITGILPG